jgi:hypothetical protein
MTLVAHAIAPEARIPGVLDELPEVLPTDPDERSAFLRDCTPGAVRERIYARRQAAAAAAQRWVGVVEVMLFNFDPNDPEDRAAFAFATGNVHKLMVEAAQLNQRLLPQEVRP